MKKVILGIVFSMLMAGGASQEIIRSNSVTAEWDAVLPMGGDEISYEIYLAWYPVLDRQNPSAHTLLGVVPLMTFDVGFSVEGTFAMGVRAVRYIIATDDYLCSDINWSDQNGAWTPNPFVLRYYASPVIPENLRLK